MKEYKFRPVAYCSTNFSTCIQSSQSKISRFVNISQTRKRSNFPIKSILVKEENVEMNNRTKKKSYILAVLIILIIYLSIAYHVCIIIHLHFFLNAKSWHSSRIQTNRGIRVFSEPCKQNKIPRSCFYCTQFEAFLRYPLPLLHPEGMMLIGLHLQ